MDFATEIVPALLGLVAGLVATFVAPWVQWGVEKRRIRMENRRAKIERWRSSVHETFRNGQWSEAGEREWELSESPAFIELKSILSEKTIQAIGAESYTDEEALYALLRDIEKKERAWDLI